MKILIGEAILHRRDISRGHQREASPRRVDQRLECAICTPTAAGMR